MVLYSDDLCLKDLELISLGEKFIGKRVRLCYIVPRENKGTEREGSRSRPWDMSIPLNLFLAVSLDRKSVSKTSASRLTSI